jgi:nucleoid-associated protein YgaU|tara:strand:+ start:211 stop:498 length:288 start_codon:yes stop_codon:yes gene_type:complete
MNRYRNDALIKNGQMLATSKGLVNIRLAIRNNQLSITTRVLKEGERIDNIAGEVYNNARLWWVIAAASGIGWAPQAPPGTFLIIPTDLGQISGLV